MSWLSRLKTARGSQSPLSEEAERALEAWHALTEPAHEQPHFESRYVVLNTEATGLDLERDRLLAVGAIAIDGTVNAMGGVRFRGGSVRISGTVYRGAKFVGLAPDFSDVVNVNGLAAGTKIVEVDGRIQVVAEDDPATAVAPVASAAEEDSENATGSVDIQASQDVSVSGVIRNEGSEGVSGGLIDIQLASGEIVKKEQGFGPLTDQIVHAHGDKVDTDRVVLACQASDH